MQNAEITGDVVINSTGNICYGFTGVYSGTIDGSVTLNSSYENDASITDADGNAVIDSYSNAGTGEFIGCASGNIIGSVNMTLKVIILKTSLV